jgi:hypothetical protein
MFHFAIMSLEGTYPGNLSIDMGGCGVYNQPVNISFMPKTLLGKWSVWLIAALVVFLIIFQFLLASGQQGGETFFSNLILAVPVMLAGLSGVASLVVGLVGIIWSRERAVLVFLCCVIGLFVLIFALGEIITPH